MYDAFIIAVLPLLWITLNLSGFITTLTYQLGHAIPALLFTKQPVIIYIGIYDHTNSLKLNAGRLTIYIRPKFSYLKNRGLCLYSSHTSFAAQFITLIASPVILAIITTVLVTLLIAPGVNIYVRALIGCCTVSAIINLAVNLFPKKITINNNSRLYYSDGYQLILMAENKNNYQNILAAQHYFDDNNFTAALSRLRKIPVKYMDESVFGLMLACNLRLNNYREARDINYQFSRTKWYQLINANDYNCLAAADIQLKYYDDALLNLNRALALDPVNFDTLYKRGFLNNVLENYTEAKEDLIKALFINETSADAFSQLAITNLKLGLHGEALINLENAFMLNNNNAYAFFAMGLYLFEKGDNKQATQNFIQAQKLDNTISHIADYIAKSEARIG